MLQISKIPELTAIVTDKLGNQLPDTIVNWQGSAGTQFAQQQTKTDAQGIAKNTLTTSQSGITTITARLNNGQHAQTNLVAVADLKSATLTLTTLNNKQSAIADNQDSITVVANLTDAYHNPLKNTLFIGNQVLIILMKLLLKQMKKAERKLSFQESKHSQQQLPPIYQIKKKKHSSNLCCGGASATK
ncbi:Ig-like domain-containing protein [Proteus mirabilis]